MKRFVAICAAILLLCPVAASAAPLDVVINEVAWMGAGGNDEWIELYNNTGSDIDLTGWYILDDVSNRYDLSGTITANSYFLIEKLEGATEITADLLIDTISLANSGDDLVLYDAGDNEVDSAASGGDWFAGVSSSPDYTMERRNTDYAGTVAANWGDNDGVTYDSDLLTNHDMYGTPRAANSVAGTLDTRPVIVHVHNLSATDVDVYFDQDVTQATAEVPANYTVDGSINPTTATLDGNDASLVHLVFGAGDLADEGGPYNLFVTGVENAGGDASDTSAEFVGGISTIAFIRDDSDASGMPDLLEVYPDAFMTVTGVTTAVGTFTYQETFFQDATGGIAIFDAATTGALTEGDDIRISGKLDFYNGKDELIDTMAVVVDQGIVVAPMILTLAELNAAGAGEMYESMLVGIAQVSNTGGGDAWPADGSDANFEITDDAGSNTYTMRIDRDTDIDGSVEPTWPVDVQGIASQYANAAPYDFGYQVFPRSLEDFTPNGGFCNVADDTQSCYSGPVGTDSNPPCQAGTQTCDGTYWGTCDGEVLPSAADDVTCDNVDDDCDGSTDEDVDTDNDPLNCGACGNDCTDDYANADGVCNAGACAMGACSGNFEDCNVDDTDGCEIELLTDTNCSACGDDCTDDYSAEHIIGVCDVDGGACAMGACETGYGDCDSSGDSCETPLGTDTDCGACGDDCTDDFLGVNANGTCNVDTCEIGACLANYADCDSSGDSCESSLTSNATCGDCNTACQAGESCIDSGGGVYTCSADCPDSDSDGYADDSCGGTDCDDSNAAVNPGETEVCDGLDNNCDSNTDEGFDQDTDGYTSCDTPVADCDDNDAAVNPGATEACDLIDNNCDGTTDEGFDADSDGYSTCADPVADCDDADAAVNPGAAELCDDVDNDCDAETDEDFADLGAACDGPDGDDCANGTYVCNAAGDGLECSGDSPAVEACDGLDNDCDGDIDEDWPTLGDACDGPDEDQCANGQLVCTQAGTGVECNETLNQNQEELCNGTDDDCDGDVDEGFGEYQCGVGACQVTTQICIDGEYQSCVPLDPPEQVETSCDDGIDNDCDDYVDEADLDCTNSGGGGGCDCASTGHNRTGAFGLALLGLLAIFRRRRK